MAPAIPQSPKVPRGEDGGRPPIPGIGGEPEVGDKPKKKKKAGSKK